MKAEKGGKAAADGWMGRGSGRLRGRKENKERKKQRIGKKRTKMRIEELQNCT